MGTSTITELQNQNGTLEFTVPTPKTFQTRLFADKWNRAEIYLLDAITPLHVRVRNCIECGKPIAEQAHHMRKRCLVCAHMVKMAQINARATNRLHAKRAGNSCMTDNLVLAMKRAADVCPTCNTRMTDSPGPRHKHLDHIIPINQGGPHDPQNVRVICRTCNLTRPRDGSDIPAARREQILNRCSTPVVAGHMADIGTNRTLEKQANEILAANGSKELIDMKPDPTDAMFHASPFGSIIDLAQMEDNWDDA